MSEENNNFDYEKKNDSNMPLTVKKQKHSLNKGGLLVFFIIVTAAVLAGSIAVINFLSQGPGTGNTIVNPDIEPDSAGQTFGQLAAKKIPFSFMRTSESYIAVLHIEGVIEDKNKTYNQSWLLSTINNLKNDRKNRAIMLYINSPGGGVYQADEVYLALKDYRKSGRSLYAYMGPLAASGGYYIACAAENISANRNTLTGSIGVIAGQSVDLTGLMDKLGIKSVTITAGKNKNMMNFNAPLTDEQKAIMQSVADEAYDQFTRIVASNRKLPVTTVRKLADGRIYTAQQAKKHNLIDSICSWDEAVDRLKAKKGVGSNCTVEDFRISEKNSLYDYITGASTAIRKLTAVIKTGTLTQSIVSAITPALPYPAYYYSQR